MPECPNCGHRFTETPEWQSAVNEYSKWSELVQLGDELQGRNTDVIVCTKHLRFVPCRKGRDYKPDAEPCVLSENPEDIGYVRRYQRGEVD